MFRYLPRESDSAGRWAAEGPVEFDGVGEVSVSGHYHRNLRLGLRHHLDEGSILIIKLVGRRRGLRSQPR
jgi:hypothetical protein